MHKIEGTEVVRLSVKFPDMSPEVAEAIVNRIKREFIGRPGCPSLSQVTLRRRGEYELKVVSRKRIL